MLATAAVLRLNAEVAQPSHHTCTYVLNYQVTKVPTQECPRIAQEGRLSGAGLEMARVSSWPTRGLWRSGWGALNDHPAEVSCRVPVSEDSGQPSAIRQESVSWMAVV
jgi:hypothetical protein